MADQHNTETVSDPVVGILLSNLGTPDAPTPAAVKRYLAEFLSDRRVVDYPRLLWLPVLHGIILRTRPKKVAHAYRQVWTAEGSPLLAITRQQAVALEQQLRGRFRGEVHVEAGMRYGTPSIASALQRLEKKGVTRLFILPLYPQYSSTTTASTFDAVNNALAGWHPLPEQRSIHDYHDQSGYIEALANSVRTHRAQHGCGQKLLFSFHGLPQRLVDKGDPYAQQCTQTATLVAAQLQLQPQEWQLTFQSRFGPDEWLQPYTDKTLEALAQEGIKSIDIISPGFSADCLETLEELAIQNRNLFLAAGGEQYHYIPALNDQPEHIRLLVDLIMQQCQDWLTGQA